MRISTGTTFSDMDELFSDLGAVVAGIELGPVRVFGANMQPVTYLATINIVDANNQKYETTILGNAGQPFHEKIERNFTEPISAKVSFFDHIGSKTVEREDLICNTAVQTPAGTGWTLKACLFPDVQLIRPGQEKSGSPSSATLPIVVAVGVLGLIGLAAYLLVKPAR